MKKIYIFRTVLIVFILSFFVINTSYANKYYVSSTGNNTDGSSWVNGYTNLQGALGVVIAGDIIYIKQGVYIPHASDNSVSFAMIQDLEIYGGFSGSEIFGDANFMENRDFEAFEVVLSGDINADDDGFTNNTENSWHVITSSVTGAILDGVTISGGNAGAGNGGGISISTGEITLNNAILKYNTAAKGGAIYSFNSTCTFSNMFLTENEVTSLGRGAAFYLNYGNVTFYNVTAVKNGLIEKGYFTYIDLCTTELINTIFWGNYDSYYSSNGYATYSNSLIQDSGGSASWNTACGVDGGNNEDEFPYFVNYIEDDVRLITNSVANGTGNPTYGSNMGYFQGTAVPVPDPLYVKADATGTGDGSDWTNAYTSLGDAIDQAITTQKIYVAKGTYYPHANDRSIAFYLKDYLEIYGGFVGNEGSIDQTVIDNRDLETNKTILSGDIDVDGTLGGNSYNVLDIRDVDSTAVLDGFEISGGSAVGLYENLEDRGAGIFVYYAAPILRNLQIIENYAKYGGGIYLYSSSPDLINISIFNNDVSDSGSGIYYYWYSSPEIHNMIIYYNAEEDNQAYVGTYCEPDYTNSIIVGSGGSTAWDSDFGIDNGNNLDTLPYAKDPYNGDYILLTPSPAINSGNATYGSNIGYYQGAGETIPDPIYVKADASGALNGTNWTDAFADLNTAINSAVPFQDIYVAKGTYKPSASDPDIAFELKEWTKIYGSFNGDEVVNQTVIDNRDFENNISILSGDLISDDDGFTNNTENTFNIIRANDLSELTLLDGFEISGGNGDGDVPYNNGGGVYCKNSNTVFRNLKITNNQTTGRAGGFYNDGGAPKISNVSISNNNSTWIAGGFANVSAKNPILTNVIIWGNTNENATYPEYNNMQLLSTSISFENSIVPESGGSTDWQAGFGIDLGGNIDTIPYFVSYTDNDIRLLDISPALSAGKAGVGTNIGFYQGVGIVTPDITITESLTDFGEIGVDLKSSEQSYTVSGSDLMDDLLIIAPSEFELSICKYINHCNYGLIV